MDNSINEINRLNKRINDQAKELADLHKRIDRLNELISYSTKEIKNAQNQLNQLKTKVSIGGF